MYAHMYAGSCAYLPQMYTFKHVCTHECARSGVHMHTKHAGSHIHVHTGAQAHTCTRQVCTRSLSWAPHMAVRGQRDALLQQEAGHALLWGPVEAPGCTRCDGPHNGFLVIITPRDSQSCTTQTRAVPRCSTARRQPSWDSLASAPACNSFYGHFFSKTLSVIRKFSLVCSASPLTPLHFPFAEERR